MLINFSSLIFIINSKDYCNDIFYHYIVLMSIFSVPFYSFIDIKFFFIKKKTSWDIKIFYPHDDMFSAPAKDLTVPLLLVYIIIYISFMLHCMFLQEEVPELLSAHEADFLPDQKFLCCAVP